MSRDTSMQKISLEEINEKFDEAAYNITTCQGLPRNTTQISVSTAEAINELATLSRDYNEELERERECAYQESPDFFTNFDPPILESAKKRKKCKKKQKEKDKKFFRFMKKFEKNLYRKDKK